MSSSTRQAEASRPEEASPLPLAVTETPPTHSVLRLKSLFTMEAVESSDAECRRRKKQEKKKERKKRHRLEKALVQEKKIEELRLIMQEIYDSRESASTFEVQFRDISQFVQQESTFLEVLNQVIVSYVEKSLAVMDRKLQEYLESYGSSDIFEERVSEWPQLCRRMTDCLYDKFFDIMRAGAEVREILKFFWGNFKNEEYDYKYLNRDIFNYLIDNHEEFKEFIKYCHHLAETNSPSFSRVDEQTKERIEGIIYILKPFIEDDSFSDDVDFDEEGSDHSTQEEEKKCDQKKKKNRRKKKTKCTSPVQNTQQEPPSKPDEESLLRWIQNMTPQSLQLQISPRQEWLKELSSQPPQRM